MKKLFLLLFLTSLIVACSNNEELIERAVDTAALNMYDKASIENATLDEKLSYKRFHLQKITSWLQKNKEEVKIALQVLNNNYNGKADTFFIDTVISQITSNQEIDKSKSSLEVDDNLVFSLNAFVAIENESWYPTMRAHNFERYLSRTPYDSTKILYALDDYDTTNQQQIMQGYQENASGELEPIDETLNEQLAGEDDIIVVELLPCAGGGQEQLRGPCDTGGETQYTYRLRIDKMTVKHHKEGWPGRSEINFKGYALSAPFGSGDCGNNIIGTSNCYDYSGRRIERYNRSWIDDQDEKAQNYLIKTQVNDTTDEVVYYVIFEEDSFPARIETHTFEMPNGDLRNVSYRSWQSPYDTQTLSMNPANTYGLPYPNYNNFSVDKNSIKYNLKYGLY